jgi:hypothetical protein
MPVHLKRSTQSEDLSSLRVVDLKQMLKQNKQKTSGKKSELIQRLKQYQNLQQKVRPKNSITSAEKRVAKELDKLLIQKSY